MIFNTLGTLICGEEIPSFLGIFDFSTAPQFLFYSYIPIIITSGLIGFYIYFKDKKSLQGKLLLWVVIFFILWVLNILVQWIASYHTLLMFAWQLTAIFEVGLFLTTVYFAYVFINKKDLPYFGKVFLWILGMVVVGLAPTKLNVSAYDVYNCEGVIGPLWNIIYAFEPAAIIAVIFMAFGALKKQTDASVRRQIRIFTVGLSLFLTVFFLSNFYGEITQVYEFNLWGPIGMLVFFILLGYLIVKFQVFHVKLFATQALVAAIVLLISSQLFYGTSFYNIVLISITLAAFLISGIFLIESVKNEIQQKEQLAKLNVDLKNLIKQRESLVHLVTHKVKGAFTRSKYIFAGILDGTFGDISPEIKRRAVQGLESDNGGIQTVDLVLNVSNMQTGTVKYELKPVDFKEIAQKSISEKTIGAEAKGLKLESDLKEGKYAVSGDTFWLKEAINNLIENSIKYTQAGKITVGIENRGGKALFSIKDTGIGITDEDKKNLFTEGGRGKDSVHINVDSTGYGLFSVKLIIDAHKGRVWGESEGPGKGSQFYIELPVLEETSSTNSVK